MRHHVILAFFAGAVLLSHQNAAADTGYFGQGDKQLTFKEEGKRSRTERITLLALASGAVLAGAVGGLYMLDARSKGEKVSATGMHTLKAWSQELEDTRLDALRSNKVGKISFGIGGALAATTIIAFMITQPDKTVGYQDWQTTNTLPTIVPTTNGVVMSQGWSF